MEKSPYKFETGQVVLIGKTRWNLPKMKDMEGLTGVITRRKWGFRIGNGNGYQIDGGFYFEEECLSLFEEHVELKEITNEEFLNILK